MSEEIPLLVPDIGDAEKIELVSWLAEENASVEEGMELCELVTDKAAFSIESPASGRLRIEKKSGEVKTGEKVGVIQVEN